MEALRRGVWPRESAYFGVAPRHGRNGTSQAVARLNVLWADLDFKSGGSEAEWREALKATVLPTFVVASGGGWH
ncbi:MAG: hypothetical protein WCD37_13820 [Chloroflexia bacterium]